MEKAAYLPILSGTLERPLTRRQLKKISWYRRHQRKMRCLNKLATRTGRYKSNNLTVIGKHCNNKRGRYFYSFTKENLLLLLLKNKPNHFENFLVCFGYISLYSIHNSRWNYQVNSLVSYISIYKLNTYIELQLSVFSL